MTDKRRRVSAGPRPHRLRPARQKAQENPAAPWWKRLLTKPVTWLVAVVIGALGLYFSDYVKAFLNSMVPADDAAERAAGPPIKVVDVHRILYTASGNNFVIPGQLTDQDLAGWDRRRGIPEEPWLNDHDVVPVDVARWEITLEGKRTRKVVVTNIKPKLVAPCAAPLGGHLVENPSQGAGDKFPFEVEIDKPDPRLSIENSNGDSYYYFDTKTIELPKDEKNVIGVTAHTSGPHCRWTIEVEYLADDTRGRLSIQAPGNKPFTVTGKAEPRRYESVFLTRYSCSEPYRRVSGEVYAGHPTDLLNCPP
jgi:hypothetical protein